MKTEDVKTITGEHWEEFLEWMEGQTMGMTEDGDTDFFPWDVRRFCRNKGLPGNVEK